MGKENDPFFTGQSGQEGEITTLDSSPHYPGWVGNESTGLFRAQLDEIVQRREAEKKLRNNHREPGVDDVSQMSDEEFANLLEDL